MSVMTSRLPVRGNSSALWGAERGRKSPLQGVKKSPTKGRRQKPNATMTLEKVVMKKKMMMMMMMMMMMKTGMVGRKKMEKKRQRQWKEIEGVLNLCVED